MLAPRHTLLCLFAYLWAALAIANEPSTDSLLKALDGAKGKKACAILKKLGEIKDPQAVGPLCRMLSVKDNQVRRAVIEALGNIGGPKASAELAALVKRESAPEDDRQLAIAVLSRMDSPDIAALISVFEIDHGQFGSIAARALAEIGRPAIDPLIAAAKDEKWTVRRGAALAMGDLGEHDLGMATVLVEMLQKSEKPELRSVACNALAKRQEPEAVPMLIDAVGNSDDEVFRSWAAVVLGKIGDPQAVEPLIAALQDKDVNVRHQAKKALGEISDPQATDLLITASQHESEYVRWAVALLLGSREDPKVVDALTAMLQDKPDVAAAAALSLGILADQKALEALQKASLSKNVELSRAAKKAIERINNAPPK